MPSYTLYYFDVRGTGEVIRLIFTYAGQLFQDKRLNREQWLAFKPETPFGELPVLEIDGNMYGQGSAICNYLARKFGLYGNTDEEAFAIDRISAVITDLRSLASKALDAPDQTKRAEQMKKFETEDIPKYLSILENLLKESGRDVFVGSNVTLADITVYDTVSFMQTQHNNVLGNYPKLQEFVDRIEATPNIKTYVDARKPTPHYFR